MQLRMTTKEVGKAERNTLKINGGTAKGNKSRIEVSMPTSTETLIDACPSDIDHIEELNTQKSSSTCFTGPRGIKRGESTDRSQID